MRGVRTGLAGVLAMGLAAWAGAADMKIGAVDMEKMLQAHPDTKEAESLIQKQVDEFDAEKSGMMEKFDKMRKEFEDARAESENKALSDEGRLQKRKDAEKKLEEMRDYDQQVRETAMLRQKQIKDRKNRMRQRIVDDIRDVIREYAQKKGYAMILDSGPMMDAFGVVVYRVEAMDITEDIKKILSETRKPTLTPADMEKPAAAPAKPAAKPEAKKE
jgi:outer membrane protein